MIRVLTREDWAPVWEHLFYGKKHAGSRGKSYQPHSTPSGREMPESVSTGTGSAAGGAYDLIFGPLLMTAVNSNR